MAYIEYDKFVSLAKYVGVNEETLQKIENAPNQPSSVTLNDNLVISQQVLTSNEVVDNVNRHLNAIVAHFEAGTKETIKTVLEAEGNEQIVVNLVNEMYKSLLTKEGQKFIVKNLVDTKRKFAKINKIFKSMSNSKQKAIAVEAIEHSIFVIDETIKKIVPVDHKLSVDEKIQEIIKLSMLLSSSNKEIMRIIMEAINEIVDMAKNDPVGSVIFAKELYGKYEQIIEILQEK